VWTDWLAWLWVGLVVARLGQEFHNPYERVKLEAETAMRAAGGHLGPEGAGKTFHLVVSDAPTQETMLAMIADYFGLRGLSVTEAGGIPPPDRVSPTFRLESSRATPSFPARYPAMMTLCRGPHSRNRRSLE
jgi:hypothetical protein